jgi:acyl carrier protein
MSRTAPGLALSYGQRGIWYLEQLYPGTSAYNVPVAWRTSGRLDVAALDHAVRDVAARHATLRTRFSTVDGEPCRFVGTADAVRLVCHDHRYLGSDSGRVAHAAVAAQAAEPFDLPAGPPCRFHLHRVDDEEYLLLASMHHMVSDGWSLGVLARDLARAYRATDGPPAQSGFDYSAYVEWQRGLLDGKTREEHVGYWRADLAGAPPALDLPTCRPEPVRQSLRADRVHRHLPAQAVSACAAVAQRLGATPFIVHLAVFAAILHRWSGSPDIVLGVPMAGRDHPGTEPLIGYFVNTVPVRIRCPAGLAFADLVRRVRTAAYDAYRHGELPFPLLVEELRMPRGAGRSPVFQVTAAPHPPRPGLDLPGLRVEPLDLSPRHAPFELSFEVDDAADGGSCSLTYHTDLFAASTMEDLLLCYESALEYVAKDPDGGVDRIPRPTPAVLAAVGDAGRVGRYGVGAGPGAAPQGDLAARVAALVADALGLPQVTTDDDFFELGGHSLRLARLVSRLCEEFGVEVELFDVVDDPTVGGITAGVEKALRHG